MDQHDDAAVSGVSTTDLLSRAIERRVRSAGDHGTGLPALSLHPRSAPTEPVPCIYDFGLAVTTQGARQVMLGDKVFTYGPGASMLTPIDLPVIAHITHATRRKSYLGLILRLDTRSIAVAVRFPVRSCLRYSRGAERNRGRTLFVAETTRKQRRQPLG